MAGLVAERLTAPQDARALFAQMYGRGFTDGLPVIPPTEDAVLDMLGGRDPGQAIATLAPNDAPVTAELAAINAVMAGCLPEYFPVVVAALKAMVAAGFNLLGIQTTTNPVAPVLLVNGPIRRRIDINCARGCLGPGWRANATIGRAVRLILVNCAGASPGEVDKAIHGMPGKYSFCFGELEEGSPWRPYHADQGFDAGEDTVTVFGGQGTANSLAIYREPESLLHVIADSMRCIGYNAYRNAWGSPLVVITPGHAAIFAEHGFGKQRIKEELFERAQIRRSAMPAERLAVGAVYDDYPPEQMCTVCRKPEDIAIVVAGGPEAYHVTYIPSFGHTDAITVAIE